MPFLFRRGIVCAFFLGAVCLSWGETARYGSCYADPTKRPEYKLLQKLNKENCFRANVKDYIINADNPETLQDMRKWHMDEYKQLFEWQSIYHNFREGVLSEHSTPEERKRAMLGATAEYFTNLINPLAAPRSLWKFLDPKMPNVKFISKDGHKEVVYNRRTGRRVDSGINQGTANVASSVFSSEHWDDAERFNQCGTPNEAERLMGDILARDPEMAEELLKQLTPELAGKLLQEINQRASQRTKELFQRTGDSLENHETNGVCTGNPVKANAGKESHDDLQQKSVAVSNEESKNDAPQITIDSSTLEKLLKKKIAFLESLLARGEPATNAQLESDNAVSQAYRAELEKIMKEIGALKISDEEKTKLFKEIEQKLQSDSKRLIQLMQQAVDEKLIAGVTFQSVNGITGTESESASDNGGCKCKNPSPHYIKVSDAIPAAVKCTRCGKTVGVLHHGKIIRTSRP